MPHPHPSNSVAPHREGSLIIRELKNSPPCGEGAGVGLN